MSHLHHSPARKSALRDRPEITRTVLEEKNRSGLEDFSAADSFCSTRKEKSSRGEWNFLSRSARVISGRSLIFLLLLASCGLRSGPNSAEITPTKQKQKIAFLQKKLQLAEREEKKLKVQIERLGDEMRDAELAYIRKQIDDYEELIRKTPSKKFDYDSADLFLVERERLHQMIQSTENIYEAQIVLDRILQLVTELSDQSLD